MTESLRLRPLLEQFEFARDRLLARLEGMTDEEYLWEPVPGCWSVRPSMERQGDSRTSWEIESVRPEPDPPPFTTLAWRLCHLSRGMTLRADYTVGTHAMTRSGFVVPTTAAGGIASLAAACAAWRDALIAATDADLDAVGHSQYPDGWDPNEPFWRIVWWVNQELLHHGAEIALLRDLYRAQPRS